MVLKILLVKYNYFIIKFIKKGKIMRLYYYTSEKYALENIKHKSLKISMLDTLNDPFEGLYYDHSDDFIDMSITNILEKYTPQCGMICFSKTARNPLMWGHYADNHKGICLGFDVTYEIGNFGNNLQQVSYINQRIDMKKTPYKHKDFEVMKFKSIDWKYEKEYRLFIDIYNMTPSSKGIYFLPFNNKLVLKEIRLGIRSKCSKKLLESTISDYKKLELYKTKLSKTHFVIDKDCCKYL